LLLIRHLQVAADSDVAEDRHVTMTPLPISSATLDSHHSMVASTPERTDDGLLQCGAEVDLTYCCMKEADSSKGARVEALCDANPITIFITAAEVISTSSSGGGSDCLEAHEDLALPATAMLQAYYCQEQLSLSPTAARTGAAGTSMQELGEESDAGWSSCQVSKVNKVRGQSSCATNLLLYGLDEQG
jgi:hypothetical protein